ncbi:g9395 [Coccomyxa elongata]
MRSQPISLDIFGDVDHEHAQSIEEMGSALGNGWIAPKQMKTLTHGTHENTAGAATTTYKKGDLAWYRQRDGTFVPAKVVSVDMTVHPPSYAVDLGGNVRETEAPRLRPRPGEPAPPPAAPPGGNTFNSAYAPLAPPQKGVTSCGPPAAVSVYASSGTVPVPVSVPVAASSAQIWPSANAGVADSTWRAAGAEAAEEDEDFGEFCDADVSAVSAQQADSSGAAMALPNGAAPPELQSHQQSARFNAQPLFAGMQHGTGSTGASIGGFLHLPAPAALPQAAAAAPAGGRAGAPLSFASFDAFRPAAPASSSAKPSTFACGAAVSGMDLLPGAAASSFGYPPSWPSAVPDNPSLHSTVHQLGAPAVANGVTNEFGDFEAADWQACPASTAASAASGPTVAHLQGKAEEAARKPEAGANGGRGVTPASTIDIAREELDFSEASDEDDFGDFEDADSGSTPAGAPAGASAPTLDRSAPLPMSLFGEENDPAEASPPMPSLDLAAPWGGFGFNQVPPDQAHQAARIFTPAPDLAPPSHLPDQAAHHSTPVPTLAPPSQAPDQAAVSPLGSAAATQLPTGDVVPVVFPACAPATPLLVEQSPCAADVTPLSAAALSAQRQGTPATAAAHEADAAACSGMTRTATNNTESDAFPEWAVPLELGTPDAEAISAARRDSGAEVFADAHFTTQSSAGEPELASSRGTAEAAAGAQGKDWGSEQGINWDALDFSFADDVPEEAPQAPESLSDAPPSSGQHGLGTLVDSTKAAQLAGPMKDAVVKHSVPSGQGEVAPARTGAASLGTPQAEHAQQAEQQMAAEDEEAQEWGEFEEFPAAENSTGVGAEPAEASHWDLAWSGEPSESRSAAAEWGAESAASPDHAVHFSVPVAPGACSGVPSGSAAPQQYSLGSAAVTWPAESAAEEFSTAELALLPTLAALQPSAGVPSCPAAPDRDFLDSGINGGFSAPAAESASPSQPQGAEAAGWGWDIEDSWLAAEAEVRPALPSADVWNTLASCDPGVPASEPQRGVRSVHEGDDMFDEGLWGDDWAAASTGTGGPDPLLVQPPAAAASGSFASHDRATALRLLAEVAEAELAEGQRIWSEACSGGCQASFCAGARERQYIMALGAVHFVACALRLRGEDVIGGVDGAATAGLLTRCQECWHGRTPGMPALKSAYDAATAAAQPSRMSVTLAEACRVLESSTGLQEEESCRTGPCCAITCLPLALCPAVPTVQIMGGRCWAPVANLWANRVQPALQAAHQL